MPENNINTEFIEEVKEISGTDLHAALSEATEQKAPTGDNNTGAWDFNKVEPETTPTEPPIQSTSPTDSTPEKPNPAAEPKGPGKVSDDVKRASAETATLMFDEFLQLTGNFAVNTKFKKKITPEEQKRILEKDLEDADFDLLEEADRILKKKFERLLKNRDRKLKGIALDDPEKKRCFTSFYNYFKIKDIAMPPEWLLSFTLGSIVIDRTIDVMAD
jgi:hypothetical protein